MIQKRFELWACLCMFSASLAFAGGETGGGGDARCAEYVDLANTVADTLQVIGQTQVSQVSKVIKVTEIEDIREKLKCLPVDQLDRQARSYSSDDHTDLLVSAWDKLNSVQKLRLTTHELSVIAKYETDGDYAESDKMYRLIEQKATSDGSLPSCDKLKYYGAPKIGDRCMTSKLAIFERVSVVGFGEAWKGPDGITWSSNLEVTWATLAAQLFCEDLHAELPTTDDYIRGVNLGINEVLPQWVDGDSGRCYWALPDACVWVTPYSNEAADHPRPVRCIIRQ